MKHVGFVSHVLAAGLLSVFPAMAGGQKGSHTLPENWRDLPLATFVNEVHFMTSAKEQPAPNSQLWQAVSSHAARLLLDALDAGTEADYHDLVNLYTWSGQNLTTQQRQAALQRLAPPGDQLRTWTFQEMRSAHRRIDQSSMPQAMRNALVAAWLEDRDIGSLSQENLGWLLRKIDHAGKFEALSFSVVWTGSIEVPASGAYTFSVCPINNNSVKADSFVRHTMAVWIDGRRVVQATPGNWSHESGPVSLQAGRKTAIRVEFSYACSQTDEFGSRPAMARLMWEGPGFRQTLVPSSVLSPPEGRQNGLRAEYRFKVGAEEQISTRTEPLIDHIWAHGAHLAPKYPELRSRLAARMWVLVLDPDSLAKCQDDAEARSRHWLVSSPLWFLRSLNSSQHRAWLGELAARPVLLEAVSLESAKRIYQYCRISAPDEALQLLGTWARMHPVVEPKFAAELYRANRRSFRGLSSLIVWNCRPHLDLLRQRYLELPDGGCSLPVAYTLSYGYWVEGRIHEWIEKLDSHLNDDELTGDRRVNWLLARAQAEEIRFSRPGRHWSTVDRFQGGHRWLGEACVVAESEPALLRSYKELAVRLAAEEQPDAAREMLDNAARRCSSASSVETLAAWRKEIDKLADQLKKSRNKEEALAQQAYIEALRRRLRRAQQHGDQQAVADYKELLAAAGAEIK